MGVNDAIVQEVLYKDTVVQEVFYMNYLSVRPLVLSNTLSHICLPTNQCTVPENTKLLQD